MRKTTPLPTSSDGKKEDLFSESLLENQARMKENHICEDNTFGTIRCIRKQFQSGSHVCLLPNLPGGKSLWMHLGREFSP